MAERTSSWKSAVRLSVVEHVGVPRRPPIVPAVPFTSKRRELPMVRSAFARVRRTPPLHGEAGLHHSRQGLPGRAARGEPPLAGARGRSRGDVSPLRLRRDPRPHRGADGALRALARRDDRHRREGDVHLRRSRRDERSRSGRRRPPGVVRAYLESGLARTRAGRAALLSRARCSAASDRSGAATGSSTRSAPRCSVATTRSPTPSSSSC